MPATHRPLTLLAVPVLWAGLALAAQERGAAPPTDWPVTFVDVASQAGLTTPSVYGGISRKRFIIETNGAGVALLDVDGDGWLDALVLNGTRLKEGSRDDQVWPAGDSPTARLYRNRHDGTFADITRGSGLERVAWSSSVCAGDIDNDGRVDLFTTAYGTNVLYRNAGEGRFTDITVRAGLPTTGTRWGSGCTFIDYDRDGRLDLFVANYLRLDLATASEPGQGINCLWKGIPVNCGPKGLPTETNLLYHQERDGTFRDVSVESGVAAVRNRYSMTATAADFDGDGWVDIYVASDSTAAILYHNRGDGTFSDVALPSGVAFSENGMAQAGMGLAVGDFNADGRLDLLKTHFADDIPALYRSLGNGLFEDAATAVGLGVRNRYVEWGAGLPDLDNDGWPDVFYVTGNVYPEVESHFPEYPHRSPAIVFRGTGGSAFEDVTARSGSGVTTPRSSRGAAFGDFDNDGDIDVLIMNMNAPPALLRNDLAVSRNWIDVALEGVASNRSAIGAVVTVTAGGRTQAQAELSQSSYYSVNALRLHFGLGDAAAADRIEVRWPNGGRSLRSGVTSKQVITIREEP